MEEGKNSRLEDQKMLMMKMRDNAYDIPKNPSLGEDIVHNILSRLPSKSLMRFKCICKSWQFLIQSDPHFVSLQFEQSKTRRPVLLISSLGVKQGTNFFSANHLFEEGTETIKAETILMTRTSWNQRMLKPVNSLICFISCINKAVLIYNLSTREATPWIETSIITAQSCRFYGTSYGFGFDHITKEHKVICVCNHQIDFNCKRDPCNQTCEVLTVGQNSWRRIHEVPPYVVNGDSFYSNGALYWVVNTGSFDCPLDDIIVVFDVGSEKFRVIEIPKFIGKTNFRHSDDDFLQVDGHIALLNRPSHGENNVTMLIFDDNEWNKSTSTGCNWIEETISISCDPEREWLYGFKAIAGTDLIIVICSSRFMQYHCLYFYDRKKKTSRKVETITHSGGIPVIKPGRFVSERDFKIDTFFESLFPVQSPRS